MANKKSNSPRINIISNNKRAFFDFFIEDQLEAGIELKGWEVKSLRAGKVNISNSYIILKHGEAFLLGSSFMPLINTFFCQNLEDKRTRKLLLNQKELDFLYGCMNKKGYTLIALSLYWKNIWCKIKIGVAKGKKKYEKRSSLKEQEWNRQKSYFKKALS